MKLKNSSDQEYANLFCEAIYEEIIQFPCLGLVSKDNSGSHKDMDYDLFMKSYSIFPEMFKEIIQQQNKIENFYDLKTIGYKFEQLMFERTNKINTHKGLIFAASIFFLAVLKGNKNFLSLEKWIKNFCLPLKDKKNFESNSVGNLLHKRYKIKGARYQAISGYKIVFKAFNYYFYKIRYLKISKNYKIFLLLIYISTKIKDTTLINKLGFKKYKVEIKNMKKILKNKKSSNFISIANEYNSLAIKNNVSPGGAADILVLTLFTSKIF